MDSKQRAKSYLFWLLEYKGRNFLHHVGDNAFELLERNMKFYDLYVRAASCSESIQSFSEFIKPMNAVSINDQESQYKKIHDYFLEYPDDYVFFGRTLMMLTSSEKIVSMYEQGKIGEEISFFLEGQTRNESCTTIDAYGNNGKEVIPRFHTMPVKDNRLVLKDVSIDLNAPLDDILTDVATFVCAAREQAAILELGDPSNEEMKKLFDDGCPGFGPCRNGCEAKDKYSFFGKLVREGKRLGYSYTAKSDQARTIGIWLWDYVDFNGCSVLSAIRVAEAEGVLKRLGYHSRVDAERGLQRAYTETARCIAQGEVLSMSTK